MAPSVLSSVTAFRVLTVVLLLLPSISAGHDYHDALHKSILFFEGQRSGKLPADQRLRWRRESGMHDGATAGVDLTGGYYDAGDNIKFEFPMAFTTTMLSWSVIDFEKVMGPELGNALKSVRWGTGYLLKATSKIGSGVVFVQVGDPLSDHNCWERPEDMDTLRTVFKIDGSHPGSDVAGETAAALAAASIVFKSRESPQDARFVLNLLRLMNTIHHENLAFNLSVTSYNKLLMLLSHFGLVDELNCLFKEMLDDGVLPNLITFNTMPNFHCKLGNMVVGKVYFCGLIKSGFCCDTFTYTSLILGYCKKS
ncbi:unnamed protein product [Vicia faba]|uniref:cellulase n=1 Tax=Vicia faba TaxID=3906 RepID=A0AAV0YHF1_VICFA|nr:unnamed protein product [Vicia faba]